MPPETTGVDYVKARLVTRRQSFDVDTLLHVHQKSVHAARESYWLRLATIVACVTTVVLLLYVSLRSYFRLLILGCFPAKSTPSPLLSPYLEFLPFPTQNSSTLKWELETMTLRDQSRSPPMHCRTHTAKPRHEVIATSLPMGTHAV